jgi:hypothetical protein
MSSFNRHHASLTSAVSGATSLLGRLACHTLVTSAVLSQGRPLPLPELSVTRSSEELSFAHGVAFVGDKIVALDRGDRDQLVLLDTAGLKSVLSFARRGRGPGELYNPSFVIRSRTASGDFAVFDSETLRMSRWSLKGEPRFVGSYSVGSILFGATAASDRVQSFATGFFSGSRLREFRVDSVGGGRQIGVIPSLELIGAESVRQHAWQGYPAEGPAGAGVVVFARHASRVDQIRPSDGRVIGTVYLDSAFRSPLIDERSRGGVPAMASGPELRFGSIAVAATSRCFVVLYSGRSRAEAPGVAHLAHSLVLLDAQLKRVGSWRLPFQGFAVDVHPSTGVVALAETEPTPRVHLVDNARIRRACRNHP